MTFDSHFGLGAVVEIAILLCTLAGGWATLKAMQKFALEKLKEQKEAADADRKKNEGQHEQNTERFRRLELKIADECLKKDDFKDFEKRFDAKISGIEHTVANAAAKAAGLIIDTMRLGGAHRGTRE